MIRKADVQQAERDLFQAVVTMVATENTFNLRRIGGNQESIEEAADAAVRAQADALRKAIDWQQKAEEYDDIVNFRRGTPNRRRIAGRR